MNKKAFLDLQREFAPEFAANVKKGNLAFQATNTTPLRTGIL